MPALTYNSRLVKRIASATAFFAILGILAISGGSGECEQLVNTLAFSPDGEFLAAGMINSRDAQVPMKHYNADVCRTVELIAVSEPDRGYVVKQTFRAGNQGPLNRTTPQIAFSRGGRHLACLLKDDLSVWDVKSHRQVASPYPIPEWLWGIAYSPDERLVALASESAISFRNAITGAELHRMDGGSPIFWKPPLLIFSPDSKSFLYLSYPFRTFSVLDTRSWKTCFEDNDKASGAHAAAFSVDSRILAMAGPQSIKLLELATRESRILPMGGVAMGTDSHAQIVFMPDGRKLATAGSYGIRLVDTETGATTASVPPPSHVYVCCIAASPDGKLVATGDTRGIVTFWDGSTLAKIREVPIHGKYRIPWTVPVTLLATWGLLHWIIIRRGLILSNAK